jgi:hypothetical protein
VTGDIIPIQIIDSRELSEGENIWLRNLDNELDVERINRITAAIERLGKAARIRAYLDAIVRANPKMLKEALKMSDLTMEQVLEEVGLIAKWEARGEDRVKREVAKNLINIGLPLEQIAQVTGLDIETLTNGDC